MKMRIKTWIKCRGCCFLQDVDFLKCSLELSRPENKGLEKAISFLENIKKSIDEAAVEKGGAITWADLVQIAGM